MKRMLLHPGSPGGKGKIVGTLQQDINAKGLVRMLEGGPEEKRNALAMLSKYPKALAYVAAYHDERELRITACRLLTDSDALLMVTKSSPHWDSVHASFERLGENVSRMPLQDCFQVALHSPMPEHKAKAFARVEAEIGGTMVSVSATQYTFSRYLDAMEGNEPCEIMEFVNTKEKVRERVVSSAPYSFRSVEGRGGAYSPETLAKILDRVA